MVTKNSELTQPGLSSIDEKRRFNPIRLLMISGLLLLLLWLGIKGWRIGSATLSLLHMRQQAVTLMANGLNGLDADEAEAMVFQARQDVLTLKRETRFLMPLTSHLGWLPQVGPVVIDAPVLLEMADAGTETAAYVVRGLKPALGVLQDESGSDRIPQLITIIDEAGPDLAEASQTLERVVTAYSQIENRDAFPAQLQGLFTQADEWLPIAQDGLKFAQVLPQIAGNDGRKQYLLLAQNDDELRPTGGFLTGVGLLTVENGRILQLDFQDANLVNDWSTKSYDFPPQPLYEHMGLELFLFRDANFWPDFPASAENAIQLYSYGQDIDPDTFDGVIAIDQPFLQLLVSATGPVPIPGAAQSVSEDNVIQALQETWVSQSDAASANEDWNLTRKDFLGVFAGAIRNRIEQDFSAVDPVKLTRNMMQAIKRKRLQLFMRDPQVMSVLEELNWDGRLENTPGQDFLLVLDTSMGYNKANIYIKRQIAYAVTLKPDQTAQANLTVTHTHTGPPNNAPCDQDTADDYANATSYLQIADQCYFNYLRVYTPANSTLLESTRQQVPGDVLITGKPWDSPAQSVAEFASFNTFANFMMVPRQQSNSNTFTYTLPAPSVIQQADGMSTYRLLVIKQAGTTTEPVSVVVSLPEGAEFVKSNMAATAVSGNTLTFNFPLTTDTLLEVSYIP